MIVITKLRKKNAREIHEDRIKSHAKAAKQLMRGVFILDNFSTSFKFLLLISCQCSMQIRSNKLIYQDKPRLKTALEMLRASMSLEDTLHEVGTLHIYIFFLIV